LWVASLLHIPFPEDAFPQVGNFPALTLQTVPAAAREYMFSSMTLLHWHIAPAASNLLARSHTLVSSHDAVTTCKSRNFRSNQSDFCCLYDNTTQTTGSYKQTTK